MLKTLSILLLISILTISCKKNYEVVTISSVSENAMNTILSKKYYGQTIGKRHHNFNGSVQIDNFDFKDSLQFIKYQSFNSPNILGLKIGQSYNHDMLLVDSNLNDKYLLFSNRIKQNTTIYPPNNLNYTDKYMNESTGPEAVLIYYYQKDSLVYFRNDPPYSSSGTFSRSYFVTFAN